MSRSYKKNPVTKDNYPGAKRAANKKVRRTLDLPIRKGNSYKKVFSQWDIRDWVSRWTWPECLAEWEKNPEKFKDNGNPITSRKQLFGWWKRANICK